MSILPKAIYTFNNPYQNANSIFHRARTNDPKICMEPQKTPNSQVILKKKKQKQKPKKTKVEASQFQNLSYITKL